MCSKCIVDLKHFECPLCLEIPRGSIWQCKNGHMICDKCVKWVKVKKMCPQCNDKVDPKDHSRNLAVESMVADMVVGCKFENEGCCAQMKLADLEKHLKECEYRPINICGILRISSTCKKVWTAYQNEDLYHHLTTDHSIKKIVSVLKTPLKLGEEVASASLETNIQLLVEKIKNNPSEPCGKIICFTCEISGIERDCKPQSSHHPEHGGSVGVHGPRVDKLMSVIGKYLGYDYPQDEDPPLPIVPSEMIRVMAYFYCVGDADLSAAIFHFGKEEHVGKLSFTAEVITSKEVETSWAWMGKSTSIIDAENALTKPILEIPLRHLYDLMESQDVTWKVKISVMRE